MLPIILAARFLLELALLAAFAWWGYAVVGGAVIGGLVAVVCVVAVATFWGLLLSPKARIRLSPSLRNGVEIAVFLIAALALASQGHIGWGAALLIADLIIALDAINPQTAARFVPPLGRWRRIEAGRSDMMRAELERIAAVANLSRDVREQVSKSLG